MRNPRLVQRLYSDEQWAAAWEHFSQRLADGRVLELAGQVLGLILERDGAKATGQHHAARALWRRSHRMARGAQESKQWLESMMRSSIGRSLRLCDDLYYYWTSAQYGIVSVDDRDAVRETMVQAAKQTFRESDPRSLLDALDEGYPYAIRQLVFTNDRNDRESVLRTPADWQWFAPVLLAAAKADRRQMVPQLAHLVSEWEERARGEGMLKLSR